MPYKRPVQSAKKYLSPFYSPNPAYSMHAAAAPQKDFFGIPLPNEKEVLPGFTEERRIAPSLSGIVQYIRQHVKIEEILLIGLIVLMLDESIDDDLLLIILIYILLF